MLLFLKTSIFLFYFVKLSLGCMTTSPVTTTTRTTTRTTTTTTTTLSTTTTSVLTCTSCPTDVDQFYDSTATCAQISANSPAGTLCDSVIVPPDPTLNFAIQEGGCFAMEIICPAGSSIGVTTPGSSEYAIFTTDNLPDITIACTMGTYVLDFLDGTTSIEVGMIVCFLPNPADAPFASAQNKIHSKAKKTVSGIDQDLQEK